MASPQVERNNERLYHNTNSTYALPNDNMEHNRLEGQAERLREIMNDHLIHSPLAPQNVHKSLDIGCGTGAMTHRIASEFPNAEVYGLDLSPVPNIREKLPNIEYIQANFNDVTGPNKPDARFKQASFDYIFSRLLALGMTNWKGYVERCVALAKPGGWVEMHDIDFSIHRIPDPLTPSQREVLRPHSLTLSELRSKSHPADAWHAPCNWAETFKELCAAKDMDLECGKNLPLMFAEAGLEDVHIKRYVYYMGSWDGMTDVERKFAEFHRKTMAVDLSQAIYKVGQGQEAVSQERVDRAVADVKKENEKWEGNRGFFFLYAVCGRKPAK